MKKIYSILITILIGAFLFYFYLPPINLHSLNFWMFLFLLFVIYQITTFLLSFNFKRVFTKFPKINGYSFLALPIIILLMLIVNIALSPLFQSKSYSKRITIDETEEFTKNVTPVDFNSLPLLDKSSSQKLGDRVMGQMPELVSQFYVSNLYTQINYNNDIIRVTPLEYNGFFKYLSNHKNGVKGYITVNSVNGDSNLIKLEKGMKYMPSAILNENLYRYLRFHYPTKIFGNESFEIDNEGNPYWIVPVINYQGIELKREIKSVVILNPITGKSKEYDIKSVPKWVDHVYSADLIIEQVNDWGKYKNGFFNSIFGQKNVVQTTDGYNYMAMDDDIYLYTGITSVSNDESNIGFILTNMRTKKTNFYAVPGAEEYSAMESAKGQVQQMNYDASFPLLINLEDRPTYLLSLKDAAGLVKMYAFVDVEDYQKVVITDASKGIIKASENYLESFSWNNKKEQEKTLIIKNITSAIIEGNTHYYFIDQDGITYSCSIKINKSLLPFIKNNDTVKIIYQENKNINEIISIKK